VGVSRPNTPDKALPGGGRRIAVKRCCNGCGRTLGDITNEEMVAAISGSGLPDVRAECGCVSERCPDGRPHDHYADERDGEVVDHCRHCGHVHGTLGSVEDLEAAAEALRWRQP